MIIGLGDQMFVIDSGVGELPVQIASDCQIAETMTDATLDTLQAYV
jgi:hypothetical protein